MSNGTAFAKRELKKTKKKKKRWEKFMARENVFDGHTKKKLKKPRIYVLRINSISHTVRNENNLLPSHMMIWLIHVYVWVVGVHIMYYALIELRLINASQIKSATLKIYQRECRQAIEPESLFLLYVCILFVSMNAFQHSKAKKKNK